MFPGLGVFEGIAEVESDQPILAMSVRADQQLLTPLPIQPIR